MEQSAFDLKVDFLLKGRRFPGPQEEKMLWRIACADAQEGYDAKSPLMTLIFEKQGMWRSDAEALYARAYWSALANPAEALQYFDIRKDGAYVIIESKGIDGGKGQVRLHRSHLYDFFDTVKYGHETSYEAWCEDLYPVGGRTVLIRMKPYLVDFWNDDGDLDVRNCHMEEGVKDMLCLDPDTHPSQGALYMGNPAQEGKQLGLLYSLRDRALGLSASVYTAEEQAAIEERAKVLRSENKAGFMPSNGICSCCEQDVTTEVSAYSTCCPLCGWSWVE